MSLYHYSKKYKDILSKIEAQNGLNLTDIISDSDV